MKITVFGAAGEVGSRIVSEALARDHEVRAVVRNPAQFDKLPQGVEPCSGNAEDIDDVTKLSSGQDLIISAIRPPTGYEGKLAGMTQIILNGAARVGVRVLILGGAASLKIPGEGNATVLTAPGFLPDDIVNIASACFAQHALCETDRDADWAYLSPPAILVPGERTGQYRLGADELVVDDQGVSQISMEDLAVVMLDEAEVSRHRRLRFTAAY
ncbi:MAG: NAD(P)H-binding protein [Candidatus Thiodiazotropha sp.]|jgi:putative NADH-flavin reductase